MVPAHVTSLLEVRPEAVVIGASAGAVDALSSLLPALPGDAAIPFIVVVHVPADGPALLVEIFSRKCALPVRQPVDKEPIGPGIWFAAPDYHLLVESGRTFAMSLDSPENFSRPSIDVLFESAADVYGRALAGVILTGASSDGARGARRIREAGGLVLVQEPATAEVALMPRAAIDEGSPQLVAPLPVLAEVLRNICREAS